MTVYCIRSECGAVKVGVTNDVKKRLRYLQTGSAQRLELVGVLPGGDEVERDLHERFSDKRTRGEWFSDEGCSISRVFAPFLPPPKRPRSKHFLALYLARSGLRQADLAERVGVQQGTISRLASGLLTPSLDLAFAIERATDGAVPASAWVQRPASPKGAAA